MERKYDWELSQGVRSNAQSLVDGEKRGRESIFIERELLIQVTRDITGLIARDSIRGGRSICFRNSASGRADLQRNKRNEAM